MLRSYRATYRKLSQGQTVLRRSEAPAADAEYVRDMKVDVGWVIKELERRLPPQSRGPDPEQLERLSPRQRHVYLAFCRGVSHRQMARELGTSISTVQQHLRRAREKLAKVTV
ncbi:MAG: sigma-70 family RNA polymerase sigma factor [Thermaerobacter sp.]|nr:sigma-70 family RNA polymerase sigma factor [Thermaerobacter sp.]MDA8145776.1 sigma-70 family RNA polymerase sigma factor [Thermaerobacter sp.]